MFSSTIKLLIRSPCYRSLHTVLPSIREQHLLKIKPNFAKHLAGNVRFASKGQNPFENINPEDAVKETKKKYDRKTPEIPKITLFDEKDNISLCTLEEATKIAEGRKLRLIKIVDMDLRSKRPIYKLMSEAQYLEEEILEKKKHKEKKNGSVKGDKILILSCRITEKDLNKKMHNAEKWLKKNFEVRVTIGGPDTSMDEQERVFLEFEKAFKGTAKFIQKRTKGGDLKFQLMPLVDTSTESNQMKSTEPKNKNKTIPVDEEELEEETVVKPVESSEQPKHNILSKM